MVARCVVLDAGPLGVISNPRSTDINVNATRWMLSLLQAGCRVVIPAIADYEIRRELLRAEKTEGLRKLDELGSILEFLPISGTAMRRAAALWAEMRNAGTPTADDRSLDADVILAAQAETLGELDYCVATTNTGHLGRMVPVALWTEISPD